MKYFLGSLYYLWKIYVLLVFIATMIIFFPILYLLLQNEKFKHLTFPVNTMWSRSIRILSFYAVHIEGNLEGSDEPPVIIANHTSYLDIFMLNGVLPKTKFVFMGKSELLKYPLLRSLFKNLNIPVDRSSPIKSAKAFISARKAMKDGWGIVIFPEGGILDPSSRLTPFKNGAFQLANSAKAPILPLTYQNNFRLLSDPSYYLYPAMPGLVKVYIHDVISKEEVITNDIEDVCQKSYEIILSKLPKL